MRSEPATPRSQAPAARAKRLHPLTLLFTALDEGEILALPALLGGVWAGGGHMARMAGWVVVLLVVPSVLWAVAEYFAFRYRLAGAELVLNYGVWRRQHRVIPVGRVQSVDLRQNALHRLLGVAELSIETAGGESAEAVLSVLDVREAEAVRSELLSRRDSSDQEQGVSPPTVLARLSAGDLVFAGATSNEAGVVAALLAGAAELAYQFHLPLPLPRIDVRAWVLDRPVAELMRTAVVSALAILLLAWLFSVAGALVTYYGFTLERIGGELRKRYGVLARREASVPLDRVQAVRVQESLLRRPLELSALKIETAGAAPGQGPHRGTETYLPLARTRDVPRLVAAVFEGLDYGALQFYPVPARARLPALLGYTAPLLLLAAVLAIVFGAAWLWLLVLEPLAFFAAAAEVRSRGYAIGNGYVALRAGFFTRTTWIVPERRVQTVHLRETRLQRRLGLATLGVDTAAGEARGVDLAAREARALLAGLAAAVAGPRSASQKPDSRQEEGAG